MSAELFIPILPPEVLHIQLDLEPTKGQEKLQIDQQNNEVFDTVTAWCDEEQLFIGGSLANAVVYAPLKPVSGRQMKQLRQLILSQPGVAGCQMPTGSCCWQLLLAVGAGGSARLDSL